MFACTVSDGYWCPPESVTLSHTWRIMWSHGVIWSLNTHAWFASWFQIWYWTQQPSIAPGDSKQYWSHFDLLPVPRTGEAIRPFGVSFCFFALFDGLCQLGGLDSAYWLSLFDCKTWIEASFFTHSAQAFKTDSAAEVIALLFKTLMVGMPVAIILIAVSWEWYGWWLSLQLSKQWKNDAAWIIFASNMF